MAILASTLFAGAALYINLVEHPARLSCGTEIAWRQWVPSYKRATIMQASLAVAASIAGAARWALSREALWLFGALAIFAVVPVTLLVIFPTNAKLLAADRDPASYETRALLEKWGRLHFVRSLLSLVAAALFVWAAVRD
ncbi:MAG: DUF1772 domain-containing protein [Vicinamibacteria bacterium]